MRGTRDGVFTRKGARVGWRVLNGISTGLSVAWAIKCILRLSDILIAKSRGRE